MIRRIFRWLASRAPAAQARADALIGEGLRAEQAGNPAEALARYRAAVAAAPDYPPAHVNLGVALEAAGELEAAARSWETALALQPANPFASFNLGKARLLAGDVTQAEPLLRRSLEAKPDFAEAHVVLGILQEGRGDFEGALRSLQSAVAARPDFAGAWRNLGMLCAKLRRWDEAARTFEAALAAEPGNADAQYWLGNALVHLQRPEAAEAAFRAAVDARPDFAEAWCNLGNVLADRGRRDEAATCLQRALEHQPGLADAHVGLGNLYAATNRPEEAAGCFRRALTIEQGLVAAWVNLGNVMKDMGAWREAQDAYRAALRADPDSAEARWGLAMAHLPMVRSAGEALPRVRERFDAEIESLEQWFTGERLSGAWRAVGVQQPFGLAYQEEDNRALLARYGALCARLMAPWQAVHAPHGGARRARGTPLRVGVVSQFFRDHSVWHALVRGWFAHLDPERFALQAFCLDAHEDAETRFARSRAQRFEQGHAGLLEWVQVIEGAQPDVLLYPEIGMDPLSVRLASLRLAPLQAASWGHPETTGLPTVDAFLSAEGMEPPGAQSHYTERLVALPNLGCAVRPGVPAGAPREVEALGLDPRRPLLLCPGTPFKYAPEHDATLAEIARRLGECQLVFFDYRVRPLGALLRARLEAAFAGRGVDPGRCLRFVPWQSPGEFRALLAAAHVYLDTIGFSGFNTALQAVEAGVPVVAREGRFLRGRLASGILRRLGLDELVAQDEAGYVERAVRLAADRGYRDALRARMARARHLLYDDLEPIRALERFLAQGL